MGAVWGWTGGASNEGFLLGGLGGVIDRLGREGV